MAKQQTPTTTIQPPGKEGAFSDGRCAKYGNKINNQISYCIKTNL